MTKMTTMSALPRSTDVAVGVGIDLLRPFLASKLSKGQAVEPRTFRSDRREGLQQSLFLWKLHGKLSALKIFFTQLKISLM